MIGKVTAEADFKRSAVTVTKKLSKWLAASGYVSTAAAEDGARRSAETGQDLVVAERAARLLQDAADRRGIDTMALSDDDYEEFDHFTIARVEPGLLWVEVREEGKPRARGPIRVPKEANEHRRKGQRADPLGDKEGHSPDRPAQDRNHGAILDARGERHRTKKDTQKAGKENAAALG